MLNIKYTYLDMRSINCYEVGSYVHIIFPVKDKETTLSVKFYFLKKLDNRDIISKLNLINEGKNKIKNLMYELNEDRVFLFKGIIYEINDLIFTDERITTTNYICINTLIKTYDKIFKKHIYTFDRSYQ